MSLQQQCLPLHHQNHRRKRHNEETRNSNEDDNEVEDEKQQPEYISDLKSMDAATYLASVSQQASQLPSVFIATKQEQKKEKECPHMKKKKNEEPEVMAKKALVNKNNNNDHEEDMNIMEEEEEEAMWYGSAMSIQYLYSQRLKLIPPPSLHHLPPVVLKSAFSESISTSVVSSFIDHDKLNQAMDEYSNVILDNFSKLRLYLHQCRNNSFDNTTGITSLKERKISVPLSKDEYNWNIFCVGKDEACGNIGGYYDVSSDDDDDDKEQQQQQDEDRTEENGLNEKTKSSSFDKRNVPPNGYYPSTSLLCQFDQIIIRRVINHHIHYITKGYNMSQQRGKWIYGLLARLEKPLHRDEASSLTILLREMCRMRSELGVNDLRGKRDGNYTGDTGNSIGIDHDENNANSAKGTLSLLNTLIIIVGIYFEQCHSLDSIMKVLA